ncbi:hypothetical protein HPT27_09570 [Permianibacter sp. IMCC34836]|uniref:HzsA-related protein n=1 Tax=Permianibacter fluminis TaxID=2738515 RepID=UPI001552DC0E|nr:hypothetical protein [Permianibacter fluminis]NQD37275.1 hypothetical protein [Permianibacter fluminis]
MSALNWSVRILGLVLVANLAGCGGGSEDQQPDPVVLDFKVAYIKRSLPLDEDGVLVGGDVREPYDMDFERPGGAKLMLRDRASPSAPETDLTSGLFPPPAEGEPPVEYDVRDLTVSYDGTKLLFALRFPEIPNADPEDQPTWNIWEYDTVSAVLRRVIPSDITAEAGQDISPHYLPDGRIVFASTRQRQAKAILLDEGKPQFAHQEEDDNVHALSLHVMNSDGSDIHQISFNQSHDMDPDVLPNGRIVFTRWDNIGQRRGMHLYTMKPDGSDLSLYYGKRSHDTGTDGAEVQFLRPKALPDGRILTILRPFDSLYEGGDLLAINTTDYIDNTQPVASMAGLTGPAQVSIAPTGVRTDDLPSPAGRYRSAFPMADGTNRMLVSWSQCRVLDQPNTPNQRIVPCTPERLADPAVVEANPLFSLYVYNPDARTQIPLFTPEEGAYYTDAVSLSPRPRPAVILDGVAGVDLDQDLVSEGVGVLDIKSVYDFDGVDTAPGGITAVRDPLIATAAQRPARFIRIEKAVSQPDDDVRDIDNSAFGFGGRGGGMREILGYVPVEPDGSAQFKVPANVAFAISVLDGSGKRVSQRHNNWMTVKPGEVRVCNGCHTGNSVLPHGRADAEAASANPGAPTTGSAFPNTEPALFADMGETMAQVWSRIDNHGPRTPNLNLEFHDDWTDPAARAKDPDFSARFDDVSFTTPLPTSLACVSTWSSLCRVTINYDAHIQPLWSKDRPGADLMDPADDETCTNCHNVADTNDVARVPAAQLDLRAAQSVDNIDFNTSYVELFIQDTSQSLNGGGVLVDDNITTRVPAVEEPVGSGTFVCTEGVLDPGPPPECVITTPVNAPSPVMRVGDALNSRFFQVFAAGGSHAGRLSDAELKLIAEWLDVGAQYYNNPFEAPVN